VERQVAALDVLCVHRRTGTAAEHWAQVLPSVASLITVHVDRGIGLVRLGEPEAAVTDLLRGSGPQPRPCADCTRTFPAGFSIGYGGASPQPLGWTITFLGGAVSRISTNLDVTVDGADVTRRLTSFQALLHGWTAQRSSHSRQLVHSSAHVTTKIVYRPRGVAFERVIVSRPPRRARKG
jgi:hypothetical protein